MWVSIEMSVEDVEYIALYSSFAIGCQEEWRWREKISQTNEFLCWYCSICCSWSSQTWYNSYWVCSKILLERSLMILFQNWSMGIGMYHLSDGYWKTSIRWSVSVLPFSRMKTNWTKHNCNWFSREYDIYNAVVQVSYKFSDDLPPLIGDLVQKLVVRCCSCQIFLQIHSDCLSSVSTRANDLEAVKQVEWINSKHIHSSANIPMIPNGIPYSINALRWKWKLHSVPDQNSVMMRYSN